MIWPWAYNFISLDFSFLNYKVMHLDYIIYMFPNEFLKKILNNLSVPHDFE